MSDKFWAMVDKKVLVPPVILIFIAIVIGVISPEAFERNASMVLEFTLKYFGWFYTIGATFLLSFCFWAALSKHGNYKFGGPTARPEMSVFNWWAISICAGIGIGIIFFGVAEPMAHYNSPAAFLGFEPKSSAAAENALRYAFFHWTFHTYAIYVSAALCIAYTYYKHNKPLKVSTALHPLIGDKIHGPWGTVVDGLAVFAIVGGVGTSLGLGTLQIGSGLEYMWGIKPDALLWMAIIMTLSVGFTISSYTGLHRGIRFLSEKNILIFFFLMTFVLVFGPTIYILEMSISAVGDYLANLIPMSFYLDPMGDGAWLGSWSVFYWAWWLAFAPIIGLFLVKLAYGRTIRQFVMVNLIGPALFGVVWFGIFGSAGIYFDHFSGAGISEFIEASGKEVSMYALFQQLPFTEVTNIIVTLAIVISFITLADSTTSTIAGITTTKFAKTGKSTEPPGSMKIFWGLLMGLLSWVLLTSGGASALQASVIICGLPILVLLLMMVAGFIKAVRQNDEV